MSQHVWHVKILDSQGFCQKKTGTLDVPVDKEELGFNKKRGSHFTPSAVIRFFSHRTIGEPPDALNFHKLYICRLSAKLSESRLRNFITFA